MKIRAEDFGAIVATDAPPALLFVDRQLATELGFDARDAGPLTQARLLEPFALLWISLAMVHGYGREIGFQFLKRENA